MTLDKEMRSHLPRWLGVRSRRCRSSAGAAECDLGRERSRIGPRDMYFSSEATMVPERVRLRR